MSVLLTLLLLAISVYAGYLKMENKRLQIQVNRGHLDDRQEAKRLASMARLTAHPEADRAFGLVRAVITNRGQAVAEDVRVKVLTQVDAQYLLKKDFEHKEGNPIEPGDRRVARYQLSKSDPDELHLRVTWRDGAGSHSEDLVVGLRP